MLVRRSNPVTRSDADVTTAPLPLLTRLNERGFRLIQLGDAVALVVVLLATTVIRVWLDTVGVPEPWSQSGWFPTGKIDPVTGPAYTAVGYVAAYGVAIAVNLVVFYFGGMYEREPRLGYPPAWPRAIRLSLAALLITASIGFVLTDQAGVRRLPNPLPQLVSLFFLGSMAVAANRHLVQRVRFWREGPPRILLIGAPDEVNVAREHIREVGERANVVAEQSTPEGLVRTVEAEKVTDVVLLSSRWLDDLYPGRLTELERRRVNVLQRVTAKETLFGLERVREVGGMPFVLLRGQTMPVSRARFKRFVELGLLVLGAPFYLPLLALIAMYQLVIVGRPILFWQERVGRGGTTFMMVKFRTMHPQAEEDGNPQLATRDDPRIIPRSRWLRAMRLDELPQLWNVWRGEMSLVGPRPERPELTAQFEELIPGYTRRYEIPPGLTGLAQVHGRYDTDPEYKLGYDLQYLVNWSPVLDVEILVRTVWVVLARRI